MPTRSSSLVEILSEGNTPREMERKRNEYFAAGVRLIWYVEPRIRTVRVFTAPDQECRLDKVAHPKALFSSIRLGEPTSKLVRE